MLVEDVRVSVERWRTATGKRREAAWHSAVTMATELATARDALEEKMEKQWRWLWTHEGHAQFAEREGAFLSSLRDYEGHCQALDAATVLLGLNALLPSLHDVESLPKHQRVIA